MTTPKSYSEKSRGLGMFRSALLQQSAFMIATTILLFISIVVPYLVDAPDHSHLLYNYSGPDLEGAIRYYYTRTFTGIYLSDAQPGIIGVILALVSFSGALFSARYLHSIKMTDLYHSLPVRREKLLLVNAGTTMLAILGPYLLIYLLTMAGQQVVFGRFGWVSAEYFRYVTMDLFTTIALVWVIYALTIFVAVNVGTTFDSLAISGTLMFLPPAVYGIGGAIWQLTTFGAEFDGKYMLRLSPFLFFFERFSSSIYYGSRNPVYDYPYLTMLVAAWVLIGCLLFVAALLCYRRRKSEIAEQTQPFGIFQMVVKCFSVFCGSALFLGLFHDRPMAVRMLALVLGGVLVGLIVELIFARGIRSMLKNIRWLALAGGVYCLLYLGLSLDVFGFESRVPVTSNIVSATVTYRGQYWDDVSLQDLVPQKDWRSSSTTRLDDPQCIEILRSAHLSLLEHHQQRSDEDYTTTYSGGYLRVQYQLGNGGTLSRYYSSVDSQSYALLAQLEDKPEFIIKNNPLFFMDEYAQLPGVQLSVTADATSVVSDTPKPMKLNGEQLNRMIAALQSDTLRQPLDEILNPSQKARGYIRLTYRDFAKEDGFDDYPAAVMEEAYAKEYGYDYSDPSGSSSIVAQHWVPITESYTDTLILLRELGMDSLLIPDLEEVYEVRITDLYDTYQFYNANRVRRMMPEGPQNYYWQMKKEENGDFQVFSVTDPAEIRLLADRGISMMFLDQRLSSQIMAMQYFDRRGGEMAMAFIRLEDLPDSVRSQAGRYLEEKSSRYQDEGIYTLEAGDSFPHNGIF